MLIELLDLIGDGTIDFASATAFSLSAEGMERFNAGVQRYREHILLRPQEISNHPEVIRRLGVIACNGMIEADIYGNVNSTHIIGSRTHPDYRDTLLDYLERAEAGAAGQYTPHLLEEAFGWHRRFQETGSMQQA